MPCIFSSMGCGSCFSIPVVAVLLVIAFVYYAMLALVIDPWLSLSTTSGLLNAAVFTAVTFMAIVSYFLAILRDPGQVPSSYLPDPEDNILAIQEVKRKSGDLRYCQKCRRYKPPRAHHCRVCRRCVLRMDHHCLWINNCVGHHNYKAFFLFVFYINVACFHSLILLGGHAAEEFGKALDSTQDRNGSVQPVSNSAATSTLVKVICVIILIPVSVALSVLLGWHIYLSFQNKTTIEYHEGVRSKWLSESTGQHSYKHPYDRGVFANFSTVLGPDVTCWFCPISTAHIGSGVRFKTYYDGENG